MGTATFRLRIGACVAVAAAMAVVPTVPMPATAAGSKTALSLPSLTSMYAMVVDDAHHHVFVSGGGANSVIDVANYDGTLAATIPREPGAAGMVIDPGSGLLYVSLQGQGLISVINPGKDPPQEVARLHVHLASPLLGPIALAAGRLWFAYGACNAANGIASLDLMTDQVFTYTGQGLYGDYCPMVNTAAGDPSLLIEWDSGLEPATLNKFDISVDPPILVQSQREERLENLEQLAFRPDASIIYAASGWPYEIDSYRTSDLSQTAPTCPGVAYPDAVAVSADGRHMVAGFDFGQPSVWTYRLTAHTCTVRKRFDAGQDLYRGGVAASRRFHWIFAASGANSGTVTLWVFTRP